MFAHLQAGTSLVSCINNMFNLDAQRMTRQGRGEKLGSHHPIRFALTGALGRLRMKYLLVAIVGISLAAGSSAFARGGNSRGVSMSQSTLDNQGSGRIKTCSIAACVTLQLSRGYKNPKEWCPQNIGVSRGACP